MTNRTFQRRTCLRAFAGLLAAATGCRAAHASDPKKMIVLYFSWSGSTQKVAEEIQRLTSCGIARIETVTPYPRDYKATVKIVVPERESKARPPIRPLPDLSAYDVIAIGPPSGAVRCRWRSIPFLKIRIFPGRCSSTSPRAAAAASATACRKSRGSKPMQSFSPAIRSTAGEA